MPALTDDLLVKIVSYITDPVTTTDELIPSGETSSYRSNPLRLAEFTLSRKDPAYVGRTPRLSSALDERAPRRRSDPLRSRVSTTDSEEAGLHARCGKYQHRLGDFRQ